MGDVHAQPGQAAPEHDATKWRDLWCAARRAVQVAHRHWIRAARHILVTASKTGHGAHEVAESALEAMVAPKHVLLRLPSFVAAAVVASQSDGVATVPANLARALGRLRLAAFRPPIALPPIAVAQYWHERYQRDPGHRWLREACFALFGRRR